LADSSAPRPGGVSPESSADRDPGAAAERLAGTQRGELVLGRAVSAYQAALGSRLIAGYALGSLAHGGFSPLVSDVDLGLVLRDPLRAKDRLAIRTVARSVRAGGSALDQRLSVFLGTPATLGVHAWLPGRREPGTGQPPPGPDRTARRQRAGGDPRPGAALVAAALAWRREWPAAEEAAGLLGRELIPLYDQYLEDHIARLQAVRCGRLADSFRRWRARLEA
jgi:hypothetical protein